MIILTSQLTMLVVVSFCIGLGTGGIPGLASLAAPLLVTLMPYNEAQAVALVGLIFAQIICFPWHMNRIATQHWNIVLFWGIAGLLFGFVVWTLLLEDGFMSPLIDRTLKATSGIVIAALAINVVVTQKNILPPINSFFAAPILFFAGLMSSLANISGPFITWFYLRRGLSGSQLAATVATSALLFNLVKLLTYGISGVLSQRVMAVLLPNVLIPLVLSASLVMGLFLGAKNGSAIDRDERKKHLWNNIVAALMAVTAIKLLVSVL